MKNFFLNNISLKLLALFLAIVTWVYIVVELEKGAVAEREALKSVLPYRMVSKRLPVKLNITGMPQHGSGISYDKIIVKPSEIVIIGPGAVLDKLTHVETQAVDVTGASKTFSRDVSIIPPTKGVIKDKFITVTIPVEKNSD